MELSRLKNDCLALLRFPKTVHIICCQNQLSEILFSVTFLQKLCRFPFTHLFWHCCCNCLVACQHIALPLPGTPGGKACFSYTQHCLSSTWYPPGPQVTLTGLKKRGTSQGLVQLLQHHASCHPLVKFNSPIKENKCFANTAGQPKPQIYQECSPLFLAPTVR